MDKIIVCGWEGYIGFALTQRLLREGYEVIGLDNHQRKKEVSKMGSISATPSIRDLSEFPLFSSYEIDIARNYSEMEKIFNENTPDIVINLAHIPSAPYSQANFANADFTLTNNINGTNNLLWLIKKFNENCHYITIGTAGEYNHYANVDIEEGYFSFEHKGRLSAESIFPRRPGSIYHTSKVASTYLIDFLARTWNLSCTDVMQGIVFGLYTDDCIKTNKFTRYDSDESFGTVINRFCTQAILDMPLTIYGKGKHKRSFISLNDSIQALMIAVNNKAQKGQVQVWNQLSEWHSMEDIATMVKSVGSKFSLEISKQYISTPRNEITEDHYYNFITDKLKSLGYKPSRTISEEIEFTLGYLHDNLEDNQKEILKKVVYPEIKWNPNS